ncbi:peptide-methionine (S)-S-oxide reductase MsrA [Parendozoicomonas haliclonae]|uniref:Peptide methionine sulfoxide reductase MsrA n=1 Tax=Parendozoicomonas haliclonae TaxID=1960125 RepID=A0A1X7AR36_9GAMM|nr:peptide-methionine (S)-S-oxide reductase MsrA [Parendozoicomonas haliclonae]SMA50602.1 Peptide methionine sulfoxide reductase MsrA [Parendozoicomonas haliclonae]
MAGKTEMITVEQALPGSAEPMQVTEEHVVFHRSLLPPWPDNMQVAVFGMGCFWGVERLFWQQPGVYLTMVGYAGGFTENPTYEQVCSGDTGHAEVVRVVFDPAEISYRQLLALFWEQHNPTQGMRQGNDIGTQYRSVIFTDSAEQEQQARESLERFQAGLAEQGLGTITTDIEPMAPFYYAETYHQQYLARNPEGYCGLKGTGVVCPI